MLYAAALIVIDIVSLHHGDGGKGINPNSLECLDDRQGLGVTSVDTLH